MVHRSNCVSFIFFIILQLTGAKIGNRLMAEAETNLAINVLPGPLSESYEVQGRGELQLGLFF
jgi:predicted membrane GTPase involved in stress response